MVEFTATTVDVSEEDDLLTVQFSGKRKYLQFVRDLEPDSVRPTYYIEVNDQGGGGYGWAARVELHRGSITIVQAKPERMPELDRVEVAFKIGKRRFDAVAAALERIFATAPGVFDVREEAEPGAAADGGGM